MFISALLVTSNHAFPCPCLAKSHPCLFDLLMPMLEQKYNK